MDKLITEISSYERYNDLFRLNINPVYDGDREYTRDYEIDSINWIRWDLILKENNIEPEYDLIERLEDEFRYDHIFELEVNYGRYDSSIRRIFVTEPYIKQINKIIHDYYDDKNKNELE